MREFPEAWSQPHSLLCCTHCVLLSGKPEPLWGAVGEGETMATLTVLWPHRSRRDRMDDSSSREVSPEALGLGKEHSVPGFLAQQ